MRDTEHITEIAMWPIEPDSIPSPQSELRLVGEYLNKAGQLCRQYEVLNERGEVMGCHISTNVQAGDV